MLRRLAPIRVLPLVLGVVGCGPVSRVVAPERPHILLVTLDTTRADRMGAYGWQEASTPHFDRLAAEGVLFLRAWAPAPLTTPAHASLLTGLYPGAHGVRNNGRFRLRGEFVTLAERLQQEGYGTAAFVAAFPVSRLFGLAQGFEHFDDDFGADPDGRPRNERRADEVTDRALAWLEGRLEGPEPVFVWVHYFDAHSPYAPPRAFRRSFEGNAYDAEIAFADAQLGRLLDAWERTGALDRTVVAVAGDHGEDLEEHGESFHGLFVYEATVRVPLVLRAPWRFEPGERSHEPVSLVDLPPTLLGLAGLNVPRDVHGLNLAAAAADGSGSVLSQRGPSRAVLAESFYANEKFGWSPLVTLLRGEDKWIAAPRPERFDLGADPGERDNLAGRDPELDSELAGLLGELLAASLSPGAAQAAARDVDPVTRERLESLGYLGGDAGAGSGSGRDPKQAIDDYRRYAHAFSLLQAGRGGEALPLLRSLVASDPSNPEFRMRLAQALAAMGESREAEQVYREILAEQPRFFLANMQLSSLLQAQGRAGESRDLWLRVLELEPGYAAAEGRLVEACLANGDYAEALSVAKRNLADSGETVEMLVLAGRAAAALGRREAARRFFKRALDLRPHYKSARDGLRAVTRPQGPDSSTNR